MSRMYPTKHDLSERVRTETLTLLNANLADGIHLSLQAKQAHWNVKGPTFISLHELFDQVYEESSGWIDLMAERAVQLGGTADGTLESIVAKTRLPAYSLKLSSGKEHLDALSSSVAAFGREIRKAIDVVDKAGDAGTADLFTEISRGTDKMLWFLEAHLQSERT